MLSELDLRHLRSTAVQAHAPWKQQIIICDKVERGEWEILWPDMSVEDANPLVENIYAEALEDKTITAGAMPPTLATQPTRGTRRDAGERNAASRRRVGMGYWERSNVRKNLRKFYRDWLHAGMMVGSPWATGFSGRDALPSSERFAYFEVVDPRTIYPLGWDSRGNLTAALMMRQRRIADLVADYGEFHPTLIEAKVRHAMRGWQLEWLEEIWYADSRQWAVAIGDSILPANQQGLMFAQTGPEGSAVIDWLVEPQLHGLGQCPIKAQARTTVNDVPRGALLDIIPQLRVAQNFMARLLDDLQASIYAPVVLDNIKNPTDYGLGAVLVGTGQGKAFIDRDRPPVNFEAQQTIAQIMEGARREAMEPAQRAGEAGAAIVSGKGTMALMGSFNAELAAAQGDLETLMTELTSVTAAFDETHCAGLKQIWVMDSSGTLADETYDPATLFKGDHRFRVTYGDRIGLDENQRLTRVAMVKQLGGMSDRRFKELTGMVDDVLDDETETAIASMVAAYTELAIPQAIQAGDFGAMVKLWEKIDTDKKTVREAVFEAMKEVSLPAAQEGAPGVGSAGGRADIMKLVRSMQAGGIPGRAEGQPPTMLPGGPGGGLPGPARRMAAETAPGGTAT